MNSLNTHQSLQKTLSPLSLWGLGVGYVISGMYCGWNLGLKEGGSYGMAIATLLIIVMYSCFSLCYAEMACAMPKAGGAFDYANRALGKNLGFIAGMTQNIEFIFAPPAIAYAIGAYLSMFYSELNTAYTAVAAYLIFTTLNIYGVKSAARFELFITILAVAELIIFAGITLPHFEFKNISHNALPNGYLGIFGALPFAIWFFLGIEGIANVAEETINPQKNISLGFGSTLITLIVLCFLTFISAVGVAGWEAVVFDKNGNLSDSPLPLAMSLVAGQNSLMLHLLVSIGLFGLLASFNGLILAAGRATFEFGRIGYAPSFLGKIHPKFNTPSYALIVNLLLGILILWAHKTGEIILISVFGALSMYILALISLMILRNKEPQLYRPYKVPLYPITPLIALGLATLSLGVMIGFNKQYALFFFAMLALSFAGFKLIKSSTHN